MWKKEFIGEKVTDRNGRRGDRINQRIKVTERNYTHVGL